MDHTYSRIHLSDGTSVTLKQTVSRTHSDLNKPDQFVGFTTAKGRMAVVSPAHVTLVVGLSQEEIDREDALAS